MANYKYLEATAQVKTGAGLLKTVFCSSGTSPTIAVYDTDIGTATTATTLIATFTATTPGVYAFTGDNSGLYFNKGIYVVLGGTTPKVTIGFD
tara:strand:+ start:53 stop:331 length:279 start_codon:yes stop_codon:yes gene_type:complete